MGFTEIACVSWHARQHINCVKCMISFILYSIDKYYCYQFHFSGPETNVQNPYSWHSCERPSSWSNPGSVVLDHTDPLYCLSCGLSRVWVPMYVNAQHISLEGALWKVRHQPSLCPRKKTLLGRVSPYFNWGGGRGSISNTWEIEPFLTKWLYFLQFCSIVFGTTHKVRAFFAQRTTLLSSASETLPHSDGGGYVY